MGIEQIILGYEPEQFFLDFQYRLAWSDTGAIADPENMRVDRHGGLAEGCIEYHVGGLAANTGQRL
ncbi:hypothetical protein D3C73_1491200 [compost metagenome]